MPESKTSNLLNESENMASDSEQLDLVEAIAITETMEDAIPQLKTSGLPKFEVLMLFRLEGVWRAGYFYYGTRLVRVLQ